MPHRGCINPPLNNEAKDALLVNMTRRPDPACYLLSAALAVTGCTRPALRGWRERNRLFPEKDVRGWPYFSFTDMVIIRIMVVLTRLGVQAQAAADAVMQVRDEIEAFCLADADSAPSDWSTMLVAFWDDEQSKIRARLQPAGTLGRDTFDVFFTVDLVEVYCAVTEEFLALRPERVASQVEAHRIVFTAMAEAIREHRSPHDDEVPA